MSLEHYGQVLRKRWLTIAALVLIGVAAAVGLTGFTSPSYRAEATGTVVPKASTAQQGATTVQNTVQSLPPLVYSPYVLRPVIEKLGLKLTVRELDKQVSADVPTGTFNLKVQATASSARKAEQIANSVSQSLAAYINGTNVRNHGESLPASLVTASFDVPALLPSSPYSPRPALDIALGLLIGLALGVAVAIVREQLDTGIRTVDDLSRLSGANPLGTIRNASEFRTRALAVMHDNAAGIEDFRSIRTNLQFVDVDSPPRQIVISSAIANEGKSVAACNIATTMAKADLKVCLVEGDLRRPRVTSYLGLDGTLGLTDVVAGTHRLDEALIPWHRGQINVMPAGTMPPDPAQFLGSKAMASLLEELRKRFDVVIIDAPPLLPVSDAAVLGAISDGVILVVRYRHAKRDQFNTALAALDAVNAKLLGTILTRVPGKLKRSYYGGYSDPEFASGKPDSLRSADAGVFEPGPVPSQIGSLDSSAPAAAYVPDDAEAAAWSAATRFGARDAVHSGETQLNQPLEPDHRFVAGDRGDQVNDERSTDGIRTDDHVVAQAREVESGQRPDIEVSDEIRKDVSSEGEHSQLEPVDHQPDQDGLTDDLVGDPLLDGQSEDQHGENHAGTGERTEQVNNDSNDAADFDADAAATDASDHPEDEEFAAAKQPPSHRRSEPTRKGQRPHKRTRKRSRATIDESAGQANQPDLFVTRSSLHERAPR